METNMKNIILVPTDFTEVCENAVNYGAETAKKLQYKLVLLHVINSETKKELKKENLSKEAVIDKLKIISENIIKKSGIDVEYISREGSIFEIIPDVAKELGAGFIVMGTHGKVGIQHFTGSYAMKVVTSSPVPVIVVQKRILPAEYKDIVLPITSEAGPWDKTMWAKYISDKLGSTIHIYKVKDEPALNDTIRVISGYFDEHGVKYVIKSADKNGNFTKQVIDYATSINSEMIMIMTAANNNQLASFILGSYDEEILFNTSQIPVMCINPREVNWKKIISY